MTRGLKRNVPPFKGGTRQYSRRKAIGVNAASRRFWREGPVRRIPGKRKKRWNCLHIGTVDCRLGLLRGSHGIL